MRQKPYALKDFNDETGTIKAEDAVVPAPTVGQAEESPGIANGGRSKELGFDMVRWHGEILTPAKMPKSRMDRKVSAWDAS